jgi:predicted MFS family arabinose efflux permease
MGLVTLVLATACGLAVANIYFAQPILDLLAASFHTSQGSATTAVTVVQLGYALGLALLIGVAAMVVALLGAGSVILLGLSAVLLDVAMTAHQVLSQREIYQLRPDARARINTVYMGSVFAGGAVGSALAGVLHTHSGWTGIAAAGIALSSTSLVLWASSRIASRA